MEYIVYFEVRAHFDATVEANSEKEAIRIARQRFSDADFGEAYNIDGEETVIVDANGEEHQIKS